MNIRKPYYREFRRRFYETLSEKGASILRYRGADNKEHYIASGNSLDVMPGGGMVETTWQELKDKRDAGKLIPGSLYRITDYQCTTTQENTRSAGHQFDIVLLALSEHKLAEEGWAMMHENIYDVKFSDGRKKCYIAKDTYYSEEDEGEVRNIVDLETGLGVRAYVEYLEIDEENKEANYPFNIVCLSVEDLQYNYFQNSNLSAWKVWYCLDNDTSRFAWADDSVDEDVEACINGEYYRNESYNITRDGVTYYAWGTSAKKYTKNRSPQIGDTVYKEQFQSMQLVMVQDGVVEEYALGHKGKSIKENIVIDSWSDIEFYDTGDRQTVDNVEYKIFKAKGDHIFILILNLEVGSDVYLEVADILPSQGTVSLEVSLEKVGTIIKHTPEKLAYNGRGVIYRLIDEWNNDVPYDFKSLMFAEKLNPEDGKIDREAETDYYYTFSVKEDGVIKEASILTNPNAYVLKGYFRNVHVICFDLYGHPIIYAPEIGFFNGTIEDVIIKNCVIRATPLSVLNDFSYISCVGDLLRVDNGLASYAYNNKAIAPSEVSITNERDPAFWI